MIWDNRPAHHGPEIRAYLTTPDLNLRLVALPGYSPDFNPDEAIWDWIREDVTADTCFGTAAKVREKVDAFFADWPSAQAKSNSAVAGTCKPKPTRSWRQPVSCLLRASM